MLTALSLQSEKKSLTVSLSLDKMWTGSVALCGRDCQTKEKWILMTEQSRTLEEKESNCSEDVYIEL